jgi:hypothetical protein
MGIPSVIVLSISVIAIFLWHYFKHRLELQRQQFDSELKLIQDIHKERFTAVCSIRQHMNELDHNLSKIYDSNQIDRIPIVKIHAASLRSLVREKALILQDSVLPKAYALTDYAELVICGEHRFDYKTWRDLERNLQDECNNIIRTIPRVDHELKRIKGGTG